MQYVFPLIAFLVAVKGELKNEGPVTATPQMGWNSWNKFACNITEKLIRDTADALVSSGLAELGYEYVNIDDCWQSEKRNAHGQVVADPERFPTGMKALADYVHSKGLKFGIYSSAGFKTCQAFPASLGLEEVDAASYAEWDVDYLKYDNCYQDHGIPKKRYSAMGNALMEASKETGRDIFYSLCEWGRENPAVWASGIGASSWRISGDIFDGWSSITTRAEITAPLWRYSGPKLGWNDPDMLEVGNGQCTDEEYRTHFSLWAMLKAPLIIGNDIRDGAGVSASTMEIIANKEVIAINQDSLGRQAKLVWSDMSDNKDGDKLIAVKCASGLDSVYEDSPFDQQWVPQSDGTIQSASTKLCLQEGSFDELDQGGETANEEDRTKRLGSRVVTTADCTGATKWDIGSYLGGSVVSRTSGKCLEVSRTEFQPLWQGKRIQTAKCDGRPNVKETDIDISEHQSWTAPNGQLLNLYQRQCLTVDRDAYPSTPAALSNGSHGKEIWASALEDGSTFAVLLLNKSRRPQKMTLSVGMLATVKGPSTEEESYTLRDLWKHAPLVQRLSSDSAVELLVPSHGVMMMKLTPT